MWLAIFMVIILEDWEVFIIRLSTILYQIIYLFEAYMF